MLKRRGVARLRARRVLSKWNSAFESGVSVVRDYNEGRCVDLDSEIII